MGAMPEKLCPESGESGQIGKIGWHAVREANWMTGTKPPAVMFLGTASNVGKSLMATALCRVLHRRGVSVGPFKAQNMSLNAAVGDGGELGRAQALQAVAAGLRPDVRMNPILIKPTDDRHSQIVIAGRVYGTLSAADYLSGSVREQAWRAIAESYDRLASEHEIMVLEGAGSPVELNLMNGDVANLRMARYADAVSLLVGDIEAGGIFASMLGTVWLLPIQDRLRLGGLIVNKFCGDPDLFADGRRHLERLSRRPVLGVMPKLDLVLDPEDSLSLGSSGMEGPAIAVIRFPGMSNFSDLEPLRHEPVRLVLTDRPEDVVSAQAVILPGSKNSIRDLRWLKARGLDAALLRFAALGGPVLALCGGFQMCGRALRDPAGVDGIGGNEDGLGWFPMETRFSSEKTVRFTQGEAVAVGFSGCRVSGYEIHQGASVGEQRPLLRMEGRPEGAASQDGRILGTYVHGLLENDGFRATWLGCLGVESRIRYRAAKEAAIDRLADAFERAVDMDRLWTLIRPRGGHRPGFDP